MFESKEEKIRKTFDELAVVIAKKGRAYPKDGRGQWICLPLSTVAFLEMDSYKKEILVKQGRGENLISPADGLEGEVIEYIGIHFGTWVPSNLRVDFTRLKKILEKAKETPVALVHGDYLD
jgi:hypothetical protein